MEGGVGLRVLVAFRFFGQGSLGRLDQCFVTEAEPPVGVVSCLKM